MASRSKKTELKRQRRDKAMGHKRKAANATKGSTKTEKALFKD